MTHKKLQLIYKHLFFYAQNYQETYFTLLWMLSLKNEIYWAVDIGHLKKVLENFNPCLMQSCKLPLKEDLFRKKINELPNGKSTKT